MKAKIKTWMAVDMRERVAIQAVREAFFSWFGSEAPRPDFTEVYEEAKAVYVLPKVIDDASEVESSKPPDASGGA